MPLAVHNMIGAAPLWRIHDSDDDYASYRSGVGGGLVSDGARTGQEGIDAEAAACVIEGHRAGVVAEDDQGRAEDDDRAENVLAEENDDRFADLEGAENDDR